MIILKEYRNLLFKGKAKFSGQEAQNISQVFIYVYQYEWSQH